MKGGEKLMKFLFLYHGSNGPSTDAYMKEWMDWLDKYNLLAVGSQTRGGKLVTKDGVSENTAKTTGYSEWEGASLEEALKVAKECPGLKYGDTVEVLEEWSM